VYWVLPFLYFLFLVILLDDDFFFFSLPAGCPGRFGCFLSFFDSVASSSRYFRVGFASVRFRV